MNCPIVSDEIIEAIKGSLAADMGEGNPKKPWGNMSLYTYFVQMYREEHKKKHPDSSVNYILDFAEKVKLSAT